MVVGEGIGAHAAFERRHCPHLSLQLLELLRDPLGVVVPGGRVPPLHRLELRRDVLQLGLACGIIAPRRHELLELLLDLEDNLRPTGLNLWPPVFHAVERSSSPRMSKLPQNSAFAAGRRTLEVDCATPRDVSACCYHALTPRCLPPLQPHQTYQNGAFVGMRTTRLSQLSRAPGLRLSRCSTLAWHRRPHDASQATVWEARVAKPWLLPTVPAAAAAQDTAGPAAQPAAVSPAVPAAGPAAAEGAYVLRAERLVPAEAMEAARRLVLGLDGQRSSVCHTWLEPRTTRRRVRPQLTCRSAPVRPDGSVTH
eukprot:scaffold77955_cov64-Phaeocystis_antarctica.AAC.1